MPPAGRFKRSRILWDHTASTSDNNNNYKNWLRAILYELQPIRMTELNRLKDGLFQSLKSIFYCMTNITTKTVPTQTGQLLNWLKTTTFRQWLLLFGVIVYYMFVRYIHSILDAGPIVLIITCFILIFTIGLSDNDNDGQLSAYSVFNKGFQKLLGSVDADALVQQHVGGGGLMGMGMAGGAAAMHDDDDIDEQEVPGVIARHRRQQRQRPPVPAPLLRPAADQAPREQQAAVLRDDNNDDNDDDDSNNNDDDNNEQQPQPNNNNNRSRRSNKKTRRSRNVEQRREIQQQRQAAVAMGFGGENEGFAMNRLVEDQVAGDEER